MPQSTPDFYTLLAQSFYLMVAAAVVGISLGVLLLSTRRERAAIFDTWLLWTAPILLIQFVTTIAALVMLVFEALPAQLIAIVLGQWLIVILGLAVLPGGLILAQRHKSTRREGWSGWIATVAGATIVVLSFSLLWMGLIAVLFQPTQSTLFDDLAESAAGIMILIPIAILAAPLEEAIFRLGLQGMLQSLERRRWCPMWVTLVVPSAIWALGHAGTLTPHGIKEFQIFIVGLVLGLVYRRYGFGACVAVHLGLNCGALALAPLEWLIFRST